MSANDYIWIKRKEWEDLKAKVASIGFYDGSGTQHHTPRMVALTAFKARVNPFLVYYDSTAQTFSIKCQWELKIFDYTESQNSGENTRLENVTFKFEKPSSGYHVIDIGYALNHHEHPLSWYGVDPYAPTPLGTDAATIAAECSVAGHLAGQITINSDGTYGVAALNMGVSTSGIFVLTEHPGIPSFAFTGSILGGWKVFWQIASTPTEVALSSGVNILTLEQDYGHPAYTHASPLDIKVNSSPPTGKYSIPLGRIDISDGKIIAVYDWSRDAFSPGFGPGKTQDVSVTGGTAHFVSGIFTGTT